MAARSARIVIPNPLGLTPLEIASGLVFGPAPGVDGPEDTPPLSPIGALEEAILPSLQRTPCVVSFSGGHDSSAVLAVATGLARREGLPLPVPATLRFPKSPETEESEWQELVVSHLALPDWVRLEFEDELDFVGPVATRALRKHGLLWPPNAHLHVPLFERARSGSLLTGLDGDGLFGKWRWQRSAAVLSRRVRPVPRDALRVAFSRAPALLKAWLFRRRPVVNVPWLLPEARAALAANMAEDQAREPPLWDRRTRWLRRRRYLGLAVRSLDFLARDEDVLVAHPLSDSRFLAAVSRSGGRYGFPNRTSAMTSLLSEVLPQRTLSRGSKVHFQTVFWNRHSRLLAERWDGRGLEALPVDAQALRAIWLGETPQFPSGTPLQALLLLAE